MFLRASQKIDKGTFRQIFLDYWPGFKEKHPSYKKDQYEEVVQKMLGCGKKEGGYTEYLCMRCGKDRRRICFTCKSSFCLSCAKVYVDNFVRKVSKSLHPGLTYRHVILTIPQQFRTYFFINRFDKDLLSALMQAGYECLEALAKQVRKQDLKIGAIIVVQTHGRSGEYNPHLHILMTNGGINEKAGRWVDLNYFRYETLHKKWQYYLFNMMKKMIPTEEMKSLINDLWKEYPDGLVANIKKGEVPERCRGLAKYLAKYLASPPISVRRIVKYDGEGVSYWYNDHMSKRRKDVDVDVYTFIGRMVQHILPKGFQRIRYFGLQSTTTFKKWCRVIKEGLKRIGRMIKGGYQVLPTKSYRKRYMEVSRRDPMICRHCGAEMDLFRIWHPKYGVIYDEWEEIKSGKYEPFEETKAEEKSLVRSSLRFLQLSLFPLPA